MLVKNFKDRFDLEIFVSLFKFNEENFYRRRFGAVISSVILYCKAKKWQAEFCCQIIDIYFFFHTKKYTSPPQKKGRGKYELCAPVS